MLCAPASPRPLGFFSVSAIGLGCLNLCHACGAPPARDDERLLLAALYGFGVSEAIVGRVLPPAGDT